MVQLKFGILPLRYTCTHDFDEVAFLCIGGDLKAIEGRGMLNFSSVYLFVLELAFIMTKMLKVRSAMAQG